MNKNRECQIHQRRYNKAKSDHAHWSSRVRELEQRLASLRSQKNTLQGQAAGVFAKTLGKNWIPGGTAGGKVTDYAFDTINDKLSQSTLDRNTARLQPVQRKIDETQDELRYAKDKFRNAERNLVEKKSNHEQCLREYTRQN